MSPELKTNEEREMPRAHLVHIGCALAIIAIMFIDMFFEITTPVLGFIPWYVSLGICIFILFFAAGFMIQSHKTLFGGEGEAPDHVVTDGIFDQVRHPMYVGILLIHLAFVALSQSLIALGAWFVIVFIYNRLANYEEDILEEMFGDDYKEYKKQTSKWVPR